MNRAVAAIALAAMLSTTACMPAAIGCAIGGGITLAAGGSMINGHCSGEGCAYRNLLGGMLALIGLSLLLGGGIGIAANESN